MDTQSSAHAPDTTYRNNDQIRIVMVGKTGAGKSSSGNTILRKTCFKSEFSPKSLTTVCEKASGVVDGQEVAVIDTPAPDAIYCNNDQIRIVMVGKTGAGKSTSGNTILGRECFKSEFCPKTVTTVCEKVSGVVDGQEVAVIDTPGLFYTKNTEEETKKNLTECVAYASPGPHVFLIIIALGRYTEEEQKTVQKIQQIFGEEADRYSMVLFTHGDLLRGKPMEEFLQDSEDLQDLVAKCNGQYHVFNNYQQDRTQVSKLLEKIQNITKKNRGSHYTTEMFQKTERALQEETQRILKQTEKQRCKEQEELKKELEDKHQEELKKVKGDLDKEKQLKENHEAKIRDKIEKLTKKQTADARKKAENTGLTVLGVIAGVIVVGVAALLKSR